MTSLQPQRSHTTEEKDEEDFKPSVDGSLQDPRNFSDPEKQDGRLPNYDEERRRFSRASVSGDPFGDESDAEVKYRTMTWWQVGAIMIAETISLGILSLPSVLAAVGIVAGVILIAGLGVLATYTGYVLGQFKNAYPHVHNMGDAGEVMLGRFGREFFGAAQTIFLIFSMGSHVLTFTIALNAITGHATCTIVWAVIGLVIFWICDIPRTMKAVSWLSMVSCVSILAACLITMIGVGIEVPDGHVDATVSSSFANAFLSVTNIIFAYAGHVAFFSFISEMKNPREFPKALYVLQITDTTMYIVVAVVIYRYCGPEVVSPALGSAGDTVKRVAYGIALPTIIIAGVIYGHVAAKLIYVRIFRGTKHMSQRTWLAQGSWMGITLVIWVIAFIIAESIPDFNDLLALISAIFASWFTYGLAGVFWLFLNYGNWLDSPRKVGLACLNWAIVGMGLFIMGAGLYASGKAIHDSSSSSSWSCADNQE